MKTKLAVLFLLVLFVHAYSPLRAAQITFGSHEKLIKIYDLPRNERYISSNGLHYDLGFKYSTYDLFLLPLFIEDEGFIVGYIDSLNYELLSQEGIKEILKENNVSAIESTVKIPFWDRWGGKLCLLFIVLILFILILKNKRSKSDKLNELEW